MCAMRPMQISFAQVCCAMIVFSLMLNVQFVLSDGVGAGIAMVMVNCSCAISIALVINGGRLLRSWGMCSLPLVAAAMWQMFIDDDDWFDWWQRGVFDVSRLDAYHDLGAFKERMLFMLMGSWGCGFVGLMIYWWC